MRPLRWFASILAVAAMIFLPALSATAPLLGAREWTVGQLGVEAVRAVSAKPKPGQPSLRDVLHQAQALQQQFGGRSASPRTRRALALAALIPVAAIVAGLCAILSLVWLGLRWRWVYWAGAGVGVLACIYAIIAARVLNAAAAAQVARLQHSISGLLGRLGLAGHAQVQISLGVTPEIGLYVLGVLFVAMLVVPAGSR